MNNYKFLCLILFFFQLNTFSQTESIKKMGFRIFNFQYKKEEVNILIKSKKGEENITKPLVIYFQGSLARPLIINYPENENYKYSLAFPFNTDDIIKNYHIAVVSKPYIPVIVDSNDLDVNYCYIDSVYRTPPLNFLKNDNLKYLSSRNNKVVKFCNKLNFVKKNKIILIGHSEGSRIAYEVSKKNNSVSNLIFLAGNPFGRYMNIIQRERKYEKLSSFLETDKTFDFWCKIIENKTVNNFQDGGDTFKSWYEYSNPFYKDFLKIKIPVFIGYGTKDDSAPFNDLYKFYVLMENKKNFHIKSYLGLEHSFYRVNENNEINYDISYWSVVIEDTLRWLDEN